MGKVVIEMSMSLDGYVAGPNVSPEQGMGEGGDRLHAWVFDDPSVFERFLREQVERSGAVILGRRFYDYSIDAWGGKGPYGDDLPCFVVTHRPFVPADPIYTVVDDGIESALAKAQEAAGSKDIMVGGADIDREYLAAGLVDELRIHVINVLFGGGLRLFEELPQRIELEQTALTAEHGVAHLTYRVVRPVQMG